jgi:protein-tyrosine phosphatase/membrane-associated phospholipid phosphatase
MSVDAPVAPPVSSTVAARPWGRAAAWLAFLGPFFFASYGFATWLTTQRWGIGAVVFDWERAIPFMPWTIVPYWAIDVLYGISLFLCANRAELDRHAFRLLTAQLISVAGFLLFPLRFTFERPDVDGVFGAMFAVLGSFDKPFNQAPSLHIGLLVILWVLYARKTPPQARLLVHAAFLLIGASVLTTWQHHFIDVPTGVAVGMFCLWLWPDDRASPFRDFRLTADSQRRRLAIRYALGAAAIALVAAMLRGAFLWLCWASLALALVALIYAALGPLAFQKRDGRFSLAAWALFAPYIAGAWINSRAWTWRDGAAVHVADGVWIGRLPSARDIAIAPARSIVDLCCELPIDAAGIGYASAPVLDLTVPERRALVAAADAIETLRSRGTVLVCCALGYSRSAMAVVAWLIATGRERDVDGAIARVCAVRPRVVFTNAHRTVLASMKKAVGAAS